MQGALPVMTKVLQSNVHLRLQKRWKLFGMVLRTTQNRKDKLNKHAMLFTDGEEIEQEFSQRFGLSVWLFFLGPNAWTHDECRFPATGVFCFEYQ